MNNTEQTKTDEALAAKILITRNPAPPNTPTKGFVHVEITDDEDNTE